MEKEFIFALISTAIYLIGAVPYWIDLVKWKNIPHIFTYGLWFVLVSFNLYVLFDNQEWYALIPSVIMFLSLIFWCIYGILRFKQIQINWFDWLCGFLWVVLIVYWFISKDVLNTTILTLIIDFIAFLPTFKKGWIVPWTETIIVYFMSAVWQIATILSLSSFENIESMLFWWYLFFANLSFAILVFFRRYYLRWWNSIFE